MQILDFESGRSPWTLADSKLLGGLREEVVRDLEQACVWCRCEPDEVLLSANEQLDGIYFIVEGAVRIFHRLEAKREVNFAQFGPGDGFGELSAIDGKGRKADAVAVGDTVIAICQRQVFRSMLLAHPIISLRLLEKLAAIIRSADQRIATLAAMSGAQRVYIELLRLATPNADRPGTYVIDPAPYHRDIAAWAGTTTDVVARALGNLMRAELLHRQGSSLVITDRDRVTSLAHAPAEDD